MKIIPIKPCKNPSRMQILIIIKKKKILKLSNHNPQLLMSIKDQLIRKTLEKI